MSVGQAVGVLPSAALGRRRGIWRNRALRGIFRYPPSAVAACVLLLVVLGSVVGPFLIAHDPNKVRLRDAFQPPTRTLDVNTKHLLGTDDIGRDVLARILVGGRVSLLVGFVAATSTALIGCAVGL